MGEIHPDNLMTNLKLKPYRELGRWNDADLVVTEKRIG